MDVIHLSRYVSNGYWDSNCNTTSFIDNDFALTDLVMVKYKIFCNNISMRKALKNCIHVACISMVFYSSCCRSGAWRPWRLAAGWNSLSIHYWWCWFYLQNSNRSVTILIHFPWWNCSYKVKCKNLFKYTYSRHMNSSHMLCYFVQKPFPWWPSEQLPLNYVFVFGRIPDDRTCTCWFDIAVVTLILTRARLGRPKRIAR